MLTQGNFFSTKREPSPVDTLGEEWSIQQSLPEASCATRVLLSGIWQGEEALAHRMLLEVAGLVAYSPILVTPGGFLTYTLIGKPEDDARAALESLLTSKLRKALARVAGHLVIGVDSRKAQTQPTEPVREPHAEHIFVVDLTSGIIGPAISKVYPAPGQATTLLRDDKIENHFIQIGDRKAVIFLCHDLHLVGPRSNAAADSEWRIALKQEFLRQLETNQPDLCLHLAHTNVKKHTWSQAQAALFQMTPFIRDYVAVWSYRTLDKAEQTEPLSHIIGSWYWCDEHVGTVVVMPADCETDSVAGCRADKERERWHRKTTEGRRIMHHDGLQLNGDGQSFTDFVKKLRF
jgi:hypothetical protein